MRISRTVVSCSIAFLGVLQWGGPAKAGFVYDANAYFVANEAGADTNPFGPFSAGHFAEGNPGSFTAFTAAEHTNNWIGNPKLQGWFINNNVIVPSVVVNTDTVNSQGPIGPLDPSQIHMHPGGISGNGFAAPIHDAILRFTAPTAGSYSIVGDWESLNGGITFNSVLKNGVSLFGSLANNSSFNLVGVALNVGDMIDFVNNDHDGIGSDSTGLRAILTNNTPSAIPEPSTLTLLGLGGIGLAFGAHRRRQTQTAA